jgi:hypothetical protein
MVSPFIVPLHVLSARADTITALPEQLEEVLFHAESRLLRGHRNKIRDVAASELGHLSAIDADHVMAGGHLHGGEPLAPSCTVNAAHQTESLEDLQSPVHGGKPQVGTALSSLLIHLGGGQAALGGIDYLEHRAALSGLLEPAFRQR